MDDVLKSRLRMALVALLLVLVAAGGVWWGRPAYRQWKQRRFLAQAQAALARGDYAGASLSTREVLLLNPANLAACQIMAGLAERAGSPAVLDWRRRVAELAPTADNRLLLASTALRHQRPPYPLASQTLDDLRPAATNLPAFHVVSAELAIRLNELDKARQHLEAAARLEPTNNLHQLNLATLRLGSTNAALAAQGRSVLEGLSRSPNLGAVALRSLATDALRRKDLPAAAAWSALLVTNPACTFEDRLQHLEILSPARPGRDASHRVPISTADGPFAAYLAGLQQEALTNAAEVRALSAWLIQHGQAQPALAWLTNLPPALRAQPPVPLAIAEAGLALKDWDGLQSLLAKEHWAELDFMRLAFLSEASRQRKDVAAPTLWRSALHEAGDRLGALDVLRNLADAWQRPTDKEEVLWQIYQRHPQERWTLAELGRLYQAQGDTRGLNRLFAVLAELNPKDFQVRNNLAATSLLLKLNVNRACDLARELHAQRPDDAIIASTYAFALYVRGNTPDALAILQKLKPDALENPPVALYYGVLLAASGKPAEARKYLDLGQHASLLPEEKQLLETARKAS